MISKTEKNLSDAFAGEAQTNRKYFAFALKAEQEGFKQVAKLFRAAAEAEAIHAFNHFKALGSIKGTKENLEAAFEGETNAFQIKYPQMIEDAKAEDHKLALISLTFANETEKGHATLYKKALESLGSDRDIEYHVCSMCGHTVKGEPPEICPICKAKKDSYKKID